MTASEPVIAETKKGKLRGRREGDLLVFRGIPYAEPPFGARRFCPPADLPAWSGIREASLFGDAYPQTATASPWYRPPQTGQDCLNLNVWAPASAQKAPVMVWIHGGGFAIGSGSEPASRGETWARDGVVFVSINYRLHLDGFTCLDGEPGNLGLLDQLAALRWVRSNVEAFGGDPDNVTVFGQSAGAISILFLLASESSRGLFRRAIVQSGTHAVQHSYEDGLRKTAKMAQALGVEPTAPDLAKVPFGHLVEWLTQREAGTMSWVREGKVASMPTPFWPIVDGQLVTREVLTSLTDGAGSGVELMIGSCADEMSGFLYPGRLMLDTPDDWLQQVLEDFGVDRTWLERYRETVCPGSTLGQAICSVWSDWFFRVPCLRVAETQQAFADTYLYEFAWSSPTMPDLGAAHSMDQPFIFDQLSERSFPGVPNPWGESPPAALAATMHQAWLGFAADGNPGWRAFDLDSRTTMVFDEESRLVEDRQGAARALWEGIR